MLTREARGEFKFVSAGTLAAMEEPDAKSQTFERVDQIIREETINSRSAGSGFS
jgi:hypothetical protein